MESHPKGARILPSLLTVSGRERVRNHLVLRRSRLATSLYRALAGRYAGVLPEGTTCSIPEILSDENATTNIVNISCVCSASVERYQIPECLPPAFRREAAFSPRNVYTMRDVVVGIPTGLCLSDERVFLESFGNAFKWFVGSPPGELAMQRPVSTLHIDSPVTCLGSWSYWHFLLEEVPRLLHALEEKPDLSVITLADPPEYVRSLVAFLREKGIIRGSVIGLQQGLYRVADYTFTSAEDDSGFVRAESIKILRKWLGQSASTTAAPTTTGSKKVYLSRRRSSRSFTNEADVEDMLSHDGFTVVYSEGLEAAEEIRLFQQAEMIVGPHGAGLSNLVWVEPGTRVIEIFSPRKLNDCYARLASSVRAKYTPQWAQPDEGWGSVDVGSLALLVKRMDQARPTATKDTICQ